jgi:plastocyanin
MSHSSSDFALLLLTGAVTACADGSSALAPDLSADVVGVAAAVSNGDPGRRIFLRDLCGGSTWDPFGGCVIDGPVSRPEWIDRVLETGSHPLWANSPVTTTVQEGTTLEVVNVGGRGHTLTRVASFGGGIIPLLNTRDDTRVPAPECLSGIVQIPAGGGSELYTFTGVGEQRYQCCFHPWMRTTVNVIAHHGH